MYICIIDDDILLSQSLKRKLEGLWYTIELFHSKTEFIEKEIHYYDFFIVDLNLGDGNGLEVILFIKNTPPLKDIPIMVISGDDIIEKKIQALWMWANDYLVKPFHAEELVARIHAHTRDKKIEESILKYGNIRFCKNTRQVSIDGTPIKLTKKEKEILEYFLQNPELLVKRDELYDLFWKSHTLNLCDNTLNVTLSNLRKKVNGKVVIETINREWYILRKV